MNPVFNEWLELILRWTPVSAGIVWVGTAFYFTWLLGFLLFELMYHSPRLSNENFAGSRPR